MSKLGRPKTQIDLDLAYKLGLNQCTLAECSAWLGVPLSTLSTHSDFSEAYKKGREKGKMSLRRYQWEMAKTNPTMAIFLGKQYLGQMDQPIGADDSETVQALNKLANLISRAKSKHDKQEEQKEPLGNVEMGPEDLGDDTGATSSLVSGRQGAGGSDAVPLSVKKASAKGKATPAKKAKSK